MEIPDQFLTIKCQVAGGTIGPQRGSGRFTELSRVLQDPVSATGSEGDAGQVDVVQTNVKQGSSRCPHDGIRTPVPGIDRPTTPSQSRRGVRLTDGAGDGKAPPELTPPPPSTVHEAISKPVFVAALAVEGKQHPNPKQTRRAVIFEQMDFIRQWHLFCRRVIQVQRVSSRPDFPADSCSSRRRSVSPTARDVLPVRQCAHPSTATVDPPSGSIPG